MAEPSFPWKNGKYLHARGGNFGEEDPAFFLRSLNAFSRNPDILRRKFDADTFTPGGERGQSRGSAAEEGVKDRAAFGSDSHKFL